MNADFPPPAPSTPSARFAENGVADSADVVDFGFTDVDADAKNALVGEVFSQVAPYYDRMNDLMSFGMHRLWKRAAARLMAVRPGMRVLDLACGSGDLSALIRPRLLPDGMLVLADINADMLAVGRKRFAESPPTSPLTSSNDSPNFPPRAIQCDAQSLPFSNGVFDRAICAFGLRNTTHRIKVLSEMRRVLRPGGLCVILEFSPPRGWLRAVKNWQLGTGLPLIGRLFFDDENSYRYLGESIMRFPPREKLCTMMNEAGLSRVDDIALPGGVAMVHRGWRLD